MGVSVFKIFFSKLKEEKWLNEMGQKGYLLDHISNCRYYFFVFENETFNYCIEYLDCSPKSEDAERYFEIRKSDEIIPIVEGNNWVYFVKKTSAVPVVSEALKLNSKFYFWRSLYCFLISFVSSVLFGYQLFAIDFIMDAGHVGDGRIDLLTAEGSSFGAILSRAWNGILEFINNTYIALFRMIFGESDAVFVLSLSVPLAIIFTILFAMNFNEYLLYKSLLKKQKITQAQTDTNSIIEGDKNAEQGI